jgi:hypothetical protein
MKSRGQTNHLSWGGGGEEEDKSDRTRNSD